MHQKNDFTMVLGILETDCMHRNEVLYVETNFQSFRMFMNIKYRIKLLNFHDNNHLHFMIPDPKYPIEFRSLNRIHSHRRTYVD